MALVCCKECNAKISDQANSCPHCGFPMNVQPEKQDIRIADIELMQQKEFRPLLEKGEVVLIEDKWGGYIKSFFNVDPGKLYLINQRIVFCGEFGKLAMLAALPVLAVMSAKAFPKIHFQILLTDISEAGTVKHGFNKLLEIYSNTGKKHKFQIKDLEKWKSALTEKNIPVI
jgi:hypothetical protein